MADSGQAWPKRGGEMGSLIRDKNWSETSLGPIEEWPRTLQLAVDICLASKCEISICWGSDLILLYNEAWKRLLGDKHPSALGLPARQVFREIWQSIKPEFEQVISTQKATESKDQFIPFCKKGQCFFDLSFCPLSGTNRSVGGIFTIASETTHEKQAKTESTELMFSQIFENIPGLYLIVKPETYEIVAASDAYLSATMTERTDIMGKTLFEVFPADPEEPQAEGVRRLRNSLNTVKAEHHEDTMPVTRYPIPRPESEGGGFEERWWNPINSPVFNSAGEIDYIIHRVEDVTPIIRQLQTEGDETDLLQQLDASDSHLTADILLRGQDLQKAKEQAYKKLRERTTELQSYQDQLRSLASQLNHAEEQERHRLAAELHDNLGQLLTVCKMKVDSLRKANLPDTVTEISDLKGLIHNALMYTRELISELKPPPVLDKEDIGKILSWVAKKMEKHGLKVTIKDDGEPKPLNEEIRTTLYQCVRELLFNVVKHADVNEATMVLASSKKRVRVTIEDQGKGFDMDGKPAPTDEGGFGLFNILERMDLLGGRLEIFSVPGKGTKATLCAPLKKKEKSDIPGQITDKKSPLPSQASVQTELWKEVKVLLADDHAMVRRGLRELIEEQDDMTIIAEASDGKEAVELGRKFSPDIIVMDVNMPVMDGIEATREITSTMPHIRVVGLSLHDQQKVADEMRNAGATAYLTKTEAFETLCATIRSEARMA